ncbi:ANK1 [Symbiodinium sp. CCMP2592]|nr:ANK1 [Symbiodinium sp. CCMP2592]
MLHIRRVSGEGLVALDLASFHETLPVGVSPVRALKQYLHSMCGLPRFRQRIAFVGDDVVLDDKDTLRPGEVQVVLLGFCQTSEAQVEALLDAAGSGRAAAVESILQRPQDPDVEREADTTDADDEDADHHAEAEVPGGLNFNVDDDELPTAAALAEAAQLGCQEPANDPAAAAVDEDHAIPSETADRAPGAEGGGRRLGPHGFVLPELAPGALIRERRPADDPVDMARNQRQRVE